MRTGWRSPVEGCYGVEPGGQFRVIDLGSLGSSHSIQIPLDGVRRGAQVAGLRSARKTIRASTSVTRRVDPRIPKRHLGPTVTRQSWPSQPWLRIRPVLNTVPVIRTPSKGVQIHGWAISSNNATLLEMGKLLCKPGRWRLSGNSIIQQSHDRTVITLYFSFLQPVRRP